MQNRSKTNLQLRSDDEKATSSETIILKSNIILFSPNISSFTFIIHDKSKQIVALKQKTDNL